MSEASVQVGLEEFKQRARRTWALGNYDVVADGIWAAGGVVTGVAGVGPGDEVLDVACGTGNAAIQAAQAGGKVTGLDLTPELFEAGRRRAAEAGVEVEFVEGDAEALPFPDESFDVVLSTFGVMFAPRHAVAASEIVRVLRPGGRIGIATWVPDGVVARFMVALGRHLPPPPPFAQSPMLWGDRDHVRELFGGDIDLELADAEIPLRPEDMRDPDMFLEVFPPAVAARSLLEPQDRWEVAAASAREAVTKMLNEPMAYLVIGGTKVA